MRKIVLAYIVLLQVTIIACDAKRAEKCWECWMCACVYVAFSKRLRTEEIPTLYIKIGKSFSFFKFLILSSNMLLMSNIAKKISLQSLDAVLSFHEYFNKEIFPFNFLQKLHFLSSFMQMPSNAIFGLLARKFL